ncbi:MAG: hypothetical protein IPO81_26560 [Kouleothrix sp.]|nr:hypothetical protein [Kouleothrix sp.]
MGNHDAAVVGLVEAARINQYGQATLAYTRAQLTPRTIAHCSGAAGMPRADYWRRDRGRAGPRQPS